MRCAGSSAPERAAGPVGQLASALLPARIAAKYEVLSVLVRPAIRCGRVVSAARKVACFTSAGVTGPLDPAGDPFATSPLEEFGASDFGVEALASGLALQAAAAHRAMRMGIRYGNVIGVSRIQATLGYTGNRYKAPYVPTQPGMKLTGPSNGSSSTKQRSRRPPCLTGHARQHPAGPPLRDPWVEKETGIRV